jgi:hypothetical protein
MEMSVLKPTGPRLALMRAIVNQPGSVTFCREWSGRNVAKQGTKAVTAIYRQLADAKLVTLGPPTHASMYAVKPVKPTTEGRNWLAASTTRSKDYE